MQAKRVKTVRYSIIKSCGRRLPSVKLCMLLLHVQPPPFILLLGKLNDYWRQDILLTVGAQKLLADIFTLATTSKKKCFLWFAQKQGTIILGVHKCIAFFLKQHRVKSQNVSNFVFTLLETFKSCFHQLPLPQSFFTKLCFKHTGLLLRPLTCAWKEVSSCHKSHSVL